MKDMHPAVIPIAIVGIVMMVPILAILSHSAAGPWIIAAVIAGIIAHQTRMIYEARLRHGAEASKSEVAELKRKVSELSDRVTTLQEIVIGGDYEVKRATDRIQEASRSIPSVSEEPKRMMEEIRGQGS